MWQSVVFSSSIRFTHPSHPLCVCCARLLMATHHDQMTNHKPTNSVHWRDLTKLNSKSKTWKHRSAIWKLLLSMSSHPQNCMFSFLPCFFRWFCLRGLLKLWIWSWDQSYDGFQMGGWKNPYMVIWHMYIIIYTQVCIYIYWYLFKLDIYIYINIYINVHIIFYFIATKEGLPSSNGSSPENSGGKTSCNPSPPWSRFQEQRLQESKVGNYVSTMDGTCFFWMMVLEFKQYQSWVAVRNDGNESCWLVK